MIHMAAAGRYCAEVRTFQDLGCQIERLPGPRPLLVAIDGPGGSGKSTFAEKLATALGGAPIVPTDDFASADTPLGWWPRLLSQVIEPLIKGRQARYQRYDWVRRELADWVEVPAAPAVILEGVSSGRLEWAAHLSFLVWIHTDRSERLRRGLERDGPEAAELWQGWMAAEDSYVAEQDPVGRADLVVDGAPTVPHDPRTSFVAIVGNGEVTAARPPSQRRGARHGDYDTEYR
jgi:uridine kinase